jgi:hypothetical protein
VHWRTLQRGKYQPERDERGAKLQEVTPVRFVQACPAGHISDIHWVAFVHAGSPAKCVGMIALVRGVIRASTASRSRLRVARSTSTNTGVAPDLTIMRGAAKNVCAGVITSSPGPAPTSCSAISSAAVADDTTRAGRPPWNTDSAASSAFTCGPLVIQPERNTSPTPATVASSSVGRANGR